MITNPNGGALKLNWLLIFVLTTAPVHAEVYKCIAADNIPKYQQQPCAKRDAEKLLDIPINDPEREAKALHRLHEVEVEYSELKERKAKQQKKELDTMRKQLELLNLQNRLRHSQRVTVSQSPQYYNNSPYYWKVPGRIINTSQQSIRPHQAEALSVHHHPHHHHPE